MNDTWIMVFLVFINLISLVIFGMDKYKASRKQWRIKESQLLFLCVLGGSIGALVSMKLFRHKTKKTKFSIGVPVILAVQIGLSILYFKTR